MTMCEAATVTQVHTIPRGRSYMISIISTTIVVSLEP